MSAFKTTASRFLAVTAAFLLMLSGHALAAPEAELDERWNKASESTKTIDHSTWQHVLDNNLVSNHPSGVNRFDYAGISSSHKSMLKDYLKSMTALDPRRYNKNEQMAYWINLYNALTVDLMIANYPTSSILKVGGGFFSRGPWDDEITTVADIPLTLNDIEHRILRPIWKDPRIHFAVNCASIGCPDLSATAFTGDNLESLLTQSGRDYLAHARGAEFQGKTLYLSKIFDWYAEDFGDSEQEVLNKISEWASPEKAKRLKNHDGRVRYRYDWDLNKP